MRYLFLLLLFACNPVKQVLKDRDKFNQVAEEVIKAGYCANDTTIITKSDTTYQYDTAYKLDTVIFENILKDTQYVTLPKKVITRTITIRDTIKSVVVDGARVLLCQKELTKSEQDRLMYKELAKKEVVEFILVNTDILYLHTSQTCLKIHKMAVC